MFRKILDILGAVLKSRAFLFSVGGLLIAFLLMNYVVMPWYVYHGGTLVVPDVTSLPFDEASRQLDDLGLVAVAADTVLDNQHPVGTVLVQNPAASSVVKYGRHVYLTVCGGELQVTVPQLRGRTLRDARFAIERSGLALGEVSYAASDSLPAGTVISQTILPSESVKKGVTIGITVSTGKKDATIEVPDLSGKSLAEAEKILARLGLAVGSIYYQLSSDLLPNTIIGQLPLAGSPVDSGSAVDLYVVKLGKLPDEN